jgi:hypothetical protein
MFSNWKPALIRFTCFPDSSRGLIGLEAWRHFVGTDPAETRTGQNQFGASGPALGNFIRMRSNIGRAEWFLVPTPAAVQNSRGHLVAIEGEDSLGAFADRIRDWLKSAPPLTRLALGVQGFQSVPDRVTGQQVLATYLRDTLRLDADTVDVLLQVNRPRKSSLAKQLTINRLSKWSVVTTSGIAVQVSGLDDASAESTGDPSHAVVLETDVNTAAEHTQVLEDGLRLPLFDELLGLTREITARGDVP